MAIIKTMRCTAIFGINYFQSRHKHEQQKNTSVCVYCIFEDIIMDTVIVQFSPLHLIWPWPYGYLRRLSPFKIYLHPCRSIWLLTFYTCLFLCFAPERITFNLVIVPDLDLDLLMQIKPKKVLLKIKLGLCHKRRSSGPKHKLSPYKIQRK